MSILWVTAYVNGKIHAKVCAEETSLSDSYQATNMDISLVKFGHPVGFLHVIPNT